MKQIFYKSVLVAAFVPLLLVSSCKKDDDSKTAINVPTRSPVDDPDVEMQTFNLNINTTRSTNYVDTVIKAFNLDFHLNIYQYTSGANVYKDISINTGYVPDLYLQDEVVFKVGKRSEYFIPSYVEGYKIDSYEGAWNTLEGYDNSYGSIYTQNNEGSFGVNGFGDRYFAFRKGTGGNYNYGYLKLNLSADATTLNIKAVAYCNSANKGFYFGDY